MPRTHARHVADRRGVAGCEPGARRRVFQALEPRHHLVAAFLAAHCGPQRLAYLVENGQIKTSVRVWDVMIEEGMYERDGDGRSGCRANGASGWLLRSPDGVTEILVVDQAPDCEAWAAAWWFLRTQPQEQLQHDAQT